MNKKEKNMRKQILVVVGALVLGLSASFAWATGGISVNIPFGFIAKDKELPAGRYEIRPSGNDETQLSIRSTEGGGTSLIPVIERLADTGSKAPKVVFDKTEDGKSYLSEVHVPGSDGFLVGIAKGKEKHVVITGQ
jgi:hypothetical protein